MWTRLIKLECDLCGKTVTVENHNPTSVPLPSDWRKWSDISTRKLLCSKRCKDLHTEMTETIAAKTGELEVRVKARFKQLATGQIRMPECHGCGDEVPTPLLGSDEQEYCKECWSEKYDDNGLPKTSKT